MSRGQEGNVVSAANAQNKNYTKLANTSFNTAADAFGNAQKDLNTTQGDINSYGDALAEFKAANPYVTGGQAETAENQQLADTTAGQAEAGGEALQGLATRTGQNAGGAIAATEHMKQQAARDLMGQQAGATERRLAAGTGYGEAVLGGTANKEGMQQGLSNAQTNLGAEVGRVGAAEGGLGQEALSTEEKGAQMPSFFDTLGSSFATQLGKTIGSGGFGLSKAV